MSRLPTEQLRAWIVENLFDASAPDDLDDDTDLIGSGVMDSLAIMRVINHLEAGHGITIDPGDIVPEHFASIRALSDLVGRKTA
jgi:acyl carrier protein